MRRRFACPRRCASRSGCPMIRRLRQPSKTVRLCSSPRGRQSARFVSRILLRFSRIARSPTGPAKMISVLQRGMRVCDMCHYGDVLMVDLDPSKGHEQRKRRPVVVVSNDAFNRNCTLTVVAAISHGRGDFELHIPFSPVPASDVSNGGSGVADGFVQLEQIRALDLSARNAVKIGSLRQKDMDTVTSMLLGCFIQPDMMVLPSY
ncbi:PemK-like protein [Bifidobacterium animalis subsp. lactis CNCM I-2494]|uniref:PemK-like protein n=4 Tax=Bifidobacterium TaxID=1678 RepID=A0A806FHL0_BIFAN|nr:PemK-like protein [Bifidobacterium animalis subsp. lactis CNCM I-2494]